MRVVTSDPQEPTGYRVTPYSLKVPSRAPATVVVRFGSGEPRRTLLMLLLLLLKIALRFLFSGVVVYSCTFVFVASAYAEPASINTDVSKALSPEMQGLRANPDDAYAAVGALGSVRMRAGLTLPIWRNDRFGFRVHGFFETHEDSYKSDVSGFFPAAFWRGNLAADAFIDLPLGSSQKLRIVTSIEHESNHASVVYNSCAPVYGVIGRNGTDEYVLCNPANLIFTNDLSLWAWFVHQTGAWRFDVAPEFEYHFKSVTDKYSNVNHPGTGAQLGLDFVARYFLTDRISILAAVHGKLGFASDHMIEETRITTRAGVAWAWIGSWSLAVMTLHGNIVGLNRDYRTDWLGFDLRFTPWSESPIPARSQM